MKFAVERVAITHFGASFRAGQGNIFLSPDTSLANAGVQSGTWGLENAIVTGLTEQQLWDAKEGWLNTGGSYDAAVSFSSSKGHLFEFGNWASEGSMAWTADATAHSIAQKLRVGGPTFSPNAACASSTHALALGAQLIQDGRAQVVIAGGVEPQQPEIVTSAYRSAGALSKSGICRPFDRRRDGFLPGTGAGFVILEAESHAQARNAEIYAFLDGWSMKSDAFHMTGLSPDGDTIARATEQAMNRGDISRVDYINAHGTGTKLNDLVESRAIHRVFGNSVPVSSTKAWTQHLLGAAGVVEAVICLLATRQNYAPPTLNFEAPDEECELDLVPLHGRSMEIRTCLSLNYGFGGHLGALILQQSA